MSAVGEIGARVRDYIVTSCLRGGKPEDVTDSTHLVEHGILDSLNVLGLVDFLETNFEVEFEPAELHQFTTIENITGVVCAKLGA